MSYNFIAIILLTFSSCREGVEKQIEKTKTTKEVHSPYVKLLDITPIYKDSIYSIYISSIQGDDKILFLKENSLSSINRESKFFLHIYPTDLSLLGKNKKGSLVFDFKNNPKKFSHLGRDYYVSETNLPNIDINKINIGQYAYRGDKSINWSVTKLLTTDLMQPIINQNEDYIILRIEN